MEKLRLYHNFYLICLLLLYTAATTRQYQLDGRSYSLESTVRDFPTIGTTNDVHEQYSFEQHRAKVQLGISKMGSKYRKFTFYMDSERSSAALLDDLKMTTESSSPKQFIAMTGLPDLSSDSFAEDFIVGPSRVLFLIDRNLNKMAPVACPTTNTNRPMICFKLDYYTSLGEILELRIFYNSINSSRDIIPERVMILIGDANIDISFGKFEFLEPDERYDGRIVSLDRFAITPGVGFAELMSESAELLFANRLLDKTKFSFHASEHFKQFDLTSFASFDGRLKSLRYDFQQNSKGPNAGFLTKQLTNLELNRMYHTIEPVNDAEGERFFNLFDIWTGRNENYLKFDKGTSNCVVSKISSDSAKADLKQLTIGKILAGADRFVQLGRARVRGIPAKVYEAVDPTIPFWIEQPSTHINRKGEEKVRAAGEDSLSKIGQDKTVISVILYFAEQDDNHPLLMVEVSKRIRHDVLAYIKHSIFVHNFVWDLDFGSQPDDDQASEMFSVYDVCAIETNKYAQVKMLLQSSTPSIDSKGSEDLSQIKDLGLSLIGAIQSNFQLPASMIYDTELRYQNTIRGAPGDSKVLLASFKLAKHPSQMVQITYLGQSSVPVSLVETYSANNAERNPRGLMIEAVSFQECLSLAAHQPHDMFFGFEAGNVCYFIGPTSSAKDSGWPADLSEDPRGLWEIYRTKMVGDDTLESYKLIRGDKNQSKLLGTKLYLKGLDSVIGDEKVELTLNKLVIENYKLSGEEPSSNQKRVGSSDKFAGFGLDGASGDAKKIVPAPLSDQTGQTRSAMTQEQCNIACLTDMNCQSYSLCLKNLELECVISKFSFKQAGMIDQLNQALANPKRSFTFKITSSDDNDDDDDGDGQQIEMIKSSSCTLYNINLLDYYSEPSPLRIPLGKRLIHSVTDRKKCAEICLRLSLEVLSEDIQSKASSMRSIIDSLRAQFDEDDQIDTMQSLAYEHKLSTSKVCRSFYYLNRGDLASLNAPERDFVESRALTDYIGGGDEVGGYCLMTADSELINDDTIGKQQRDLPIVHAYIDMYNFKIELLYEKVHDVRLLGSELNKNENRVYQLALAQERGISKDDYSILQQVFERGDNIQHELFKDALACARICFFQSKGPWPACHSFDIVINLDQGEHKSRCYLNSITLEQAVKGKRSDLIGNQAKSTNIQVWHFEPRSGFAASEAKLSDNIERAYLYTLVGRLQDTFGPQIGPFAIFCVVLLALIGGSFLGLHIGTRVINNGRDPEDKDVLYNERDRHDTNLDM